MQPEFDDLLNRVTHSLRHDPELQLEIQRELRTHLRDSQAQYIAAGFSEEEARAKAVEALGNEHELNDQLWQANRRRMKFRAIVKWLATILLAPAALITAGLILLSVLRSVAPVALSILHQQNGSESAIALMRSQSEKLLPPLSPDQQNILPPDIAIGYSSIDDAFPPAEAASRAHPNDVVLLANYAAAYLEKCAIDTGLGKSLQPLSTVQLQTVLQILQRGEKLDPDNALFPLLEADCLIGASSHFADDQPASYFPWSVEQYNGRTETRSCSKLIVDDEHLFSRGIQAFQAAIAKPRLDSYWTALAKRREQLMGGGESLGKQLLRMNIMVFGRFSMPIDCWRPLFALSAHSLELATNGQTIHALQLQVGIHRIVLLLDQADPLSVQTSWVSRFYLYSTAGHAAAVLQVVGKNAEADALRQWILQQSERDSRAFTSSGPRSGSLIDATFRYYISHVAYSAAPLVRAEYAVWDQVGLVLIVAMLLIAAAASAIGALLEKIAADKRRGSAMVFLPRLREWGWLLFAATVPILLYVAYVQFVPAGSRLYGWEERDKTVDLEYAIVSVAVLAASMLAAAQVARRHLVAVGGDAGVLSSFGPGATVFFAVLAALVFFIPIAIVLASSNPRPHDMLAVTVPMAFILVLIALLIALRLRGSMPRWQERLIAKCGRVITVVLAVVAVTALVVPLIFIIPSDYPRPGYILSFTISIALLIATIPLYFSLRLRQQRSASNGTAAHIRVAGSVLRTLSMISATLALVLSLVGGVALHFSETAAVRDIQRNPMLNQVSLETDPAVRQVRDQITCRSEIVVSQCQDALADFSRPK